MSRQAAGEGSALMRKSNDDVMTLGDLIAAAFDLAARRGGAPDQVSRLATGAVTRVLRRARRGLIIDQGAGRPS